MRVACFCVAVGALVLFVGSACGSSSDPQLYSAYPTVACLQEQPGYKQQLSEKKGFTVSTPLLGYYTRIMRFEGWKLAGFSVAFDLDVMPVPLSQEGIALTTLPNFAAVAVFGSEATAERYFAINWRYAKQDPQGRLIVQRHRNLVVLWDHAARRTDLALLAGCLRTGNPALRQVTPYVKRETNQADQHLAEQGLLRRAQFSAVWQSRPWFTGPCPVEGTFELLTQTGHAFSEIIYRLSPETTISSETTVFKTVAEAKTGFALTLDNRYCNTADYNPNTTAKYRSYKPLTFPRYGNTSNAVRLVFLRSSYTSYPPTQEIGYKDTIIVRQGRAITKIIAATYNVPLTQSFEESLLTRAGIHKRA
jgi:hypothetical protein